MGLREAGHHGIVNHLHHSGDKLQKHLNIRLFKIDEGDAAELKQVGGHGLAWFFENINKMMLL
ncbi:hypothetical protein D3C72_2401080 [compost metagenome]